MADIHTPQLLEIKNMRLYVGHNKGLVIADFGTSFSHMEVTPDQAELLATLLMKHARIARGFVPMTIAPNA